MSGLGFLLILVTIYPVKLPPHNIPPISVTVPFEKPVLFPTLAACQKAAAPFMNPLTPSLQTYCLETSQ